MAFQTVVQISDTHLMQSPHAQFVGMNPEDTFLGLMQHIQATHSPIDCLVHTGDLAQEAHPHTYTRYLEYMGSLKIPFYQTPGNHDDLNCFPLQNYERVSVIDLKPWSIILINSAVKGRTDGCIAETDLQMLIYFLEQHQDRHIIVACHHHPIEMQSHWIDQHKLKNTPDFANVLKQYPNIKAVIHGHVHQEAHQKLGHIDIFSVPSTCVQFKPKSYNFALDAMAPGYRILKLHDNGEFFTQVYRVPALIPNTDPSLSGY